jgi:gluconolactonase
MYFTDPYYGQHDDPEKELSFAGVFRVPRGSGKVILLESDLLGPNGLAFSPDESKLYISNTGLEEE